MFFFEDNNYVLQKGNPIGESLSSMFIPSYTGKSFIPNSKPVILI